MVAEVARRKALAAVLEKASILDTAGTKIDLNDLNTTDALATTRVLTMRVLTMRVTTMRVTNRLDSVIRLGSARAGLRPPCTIGMPPAHLSRRHTSSIGRPSPGAR